MANGIARAIFDQLIEVGSGAPTSYGLDAHFGQAPLAGEPREQPLDRRNSGIPGGIRARRYGGSNRAAPGGNANRIWQVSKCLSPRSVGISVNSRVSLRCAPTSKRSGMAGMRNAGVAEIVQTTAAARGALIQQGEPHSHRPAYGEGPRQVTPQPQGRALPAGGAQDGVEYDQGQQRDADCRRPAARHRVTDLSVNASAVHTTPTPMTPTMRSRDGSMQRRRCVPVMRAVPPWRRGCRATGRRPSGRRVARPLTAPCDGARRRAPPF